MQRKNPMVNIACNFHDFFDKPLNFVLEKEDIASHSK
jgi:hypothetical protein